jgi:putative oxidoreductase
MHAANESRKFSPAKLLTQWATVVRLLFGGLMAYGGVMHFTVATSSYNDTFLNAIDASGFMWQEIGIVNFVAGVALLLNRRVALASIALFPISLNIFLLHAFNADPAGLSIGIPILGLNLALLYVVRDSWRGLLR